MAHHAFRIFLTAAVLVARASSAHGGMLYVANNGLDGGECGPKAHPCRSITRAIANAAAGDKIVVGPGRYGDLNRNGTLGETGEETPSSGCGCMLSLNKPVSVTSSNGAAVTVIDATSSPERTNLLIITNGGEFGKPGKGFTVTNTGASNSNGVVIDGANIAVRGNQVVATRKGGIASLGIFAIDDGPGPIVIEANQVIGWQEDGIRAESAGKTLRKNVSVMNDAGIAASGATNVVGNVVIGGFTDGISIQGSGMVVGNTSVGNNGFGGFDIGLFTGVFEKNNTFSNKNDCELVNFVPSLAAANNYWGAETGPGADPADGVCADPATVTPFAKKPFPIKAPIKP